MTRDRLEWEPTLGTKRECAASEGAIGWLWQIRHRMAGIYLAWVPVSDRWNNEYGIPVRSVERGKELAQMMEDELNDH